MNANQEGRAPKRRIWGFVRFVRNMAVLGIVFFAGLSVGDGSFNVTLPGKNQPVTKGLPARLDYTNANQVYQSLIDNYDGKLDAKQLEDGLSHGIAEAVNDPYTVYFTSKEAKEFNSQLNNTFSGIGAQLGKDKDGNLEVVAPIDGLPAQKAGLKAKDVIASVNDQSTEGMSIDEAVSKIRGEKGTKVKLQIIRNREKSLTFTITREDIKIPSIKTKVLDGNIGYIQVSTFSDDTTRLMNEAANDLKGKKVKGIILDLRSNPGGLLDAAVDMSSLWLPSGKMILQEKRGGVTVTSSFESKGGNVLTGTPTVILIDSGSASASEIVAGALRDNKAAYVIGEKSYGKGVVQQLISFGDGAQLKVTVASWYRPNGQNINKKGITPDQTVKISEEDAEAGNDTQLKAALTYLAK